MRGSECWWNAVAAIAAVAKVDWSGLGLGGLARVGLEQQLSFLEELYTSGARGVVKPLVSAGLQYLRANAPQDEPLSLSWGDAALATGPVRCVSHLLLPAVTYADVGNGSVTRRRRTVAVLAR